jgi:flagellar biosynthetic protein FliQ
VTEDFIVNIFREAFYTAMIIAAPILLTSLFVGMLISIFQAATSIQEFTLTFVPKLVAVAVVTVLFLPWMIDVLVTFTLNLFQNIPTLAR